MREKRGLLIYLIGSLMLAVSVFLPYFRYKFVLKGLIEYKESYNLMHLKKLEEWFSGFGHVSTPARVMIYLVLAAGILGVILGAYQMLSRDDFLTAGMFGLMNIPALFGLLANIMLRKDRMISDVSEVIHNYKADLLQQGFSGSSGYGLGFFLLLVGMLLVILGEIIYFLDSK